MAIDLDHHPPCNALVQRSRWEDTFFCGNRPIDNAYISVTGVCSVYSASQATVNATNIFAKETGQWITAFFSSTLATNLLSSGKLVQLQGPVTFSIFS